MGMLQIRQHKPESSWTFDTSSNIGGSAGFGIAIGGGKGTIYLTSTTFGQTVFNYASAGAGSGVGTKVTLSVSTKDTWSAGVIYMLKSFGGADLQPRDIQGCCLLMDASATIPLVSLGGTVMLLGLDASKLLPEIASLEGQLVAAAASPFGVMIADKMGLFRSTAKAVLFMGGLGGGIGTGIGLLGSIGYLWIGSVKPTEMVDIEWASNTSQRIRSSNIAMDDAPPLRLEGDVLFAFNEYDLSNKAVGELNKAHM